MATVLAGVAGTAITVAVVNVIVLLLTMILAFFYVRQQRER